MNATAEVGDAARGERASERPWLELDLSDAFVYIHSGRRRVVALDSRYRGAARRDVITSSTAARRRGINGIPKRPFAFCIIVIYLARDMVHLFSMHFPVFLTLRRKI